MFDLIPFGRNERSLFDYFDNLEKNFFGNALTNTSTAFRTDILDKGDHFELQAELPGFSKEDIKVDVDNDRMVISAAHKEETEDKSGEYVRRERRYGSFSRSFDITGIDSQHITASYNDGVLCLSLPKNQPAPTPPSRQIEIQ